MSSDLSSIQSQFNLNSVKSNPENVYEFEDFRLDAAHLMLYKDEKPISLAPKVVETLVALVERHGEVVSKREMMNRLWADSFVEESNLTQNIYLLRKTLGKGADGRDLIETFRRRGYRFTGKIKRAADKIDKSDAAEIGFSAQPEANDDSRAAQHENETIRTGRDETTPTAAHPTSGAEHTVNQTKWHKTGAFIVVGMLALIGLIYGLYKFYDSRQSPPGANIRVTPLTSSPAPERNPALSPDGRQIAYVWIGEKNENFDIYVKITDAGTPLRLTDNPARDMSPAWSPDARFIAFLRGTGESRGFYIVPALGGPERKLADAFGWNGLGVKSQSVDWSPDGKTLAVVDKSSESEPWSIFLISVETGEKRQITTPPAQTNGDILVAFSPDGKTLAFARTNALTGNIFLIPVAGGEPTQLTFDKRTTLFGLDWTSDGKYLIFSAGSGGRGTLWTISATGGERASVPGGGENIQDLTVSAQDNRLVYAQLSMDINIWRMELAGSTQGRRQGALPPTKLISSTRIEDNPQFSPDGQKIAFKSNRSGSDEIWTCGSEGQNPAQLTDLGGAFADNPRWSPDGRFIVFEVRAQGNADIYVVSSEGGSPHRLTTDESEDAVPSWSRDGRFIYFASNRTGTIEVWKMPATGGEAVQITRAGGFASSESPDGKTLYYSKGRDEAAPLWKVSVEGGEELPVIEQKIKQQWAISQRGIYFVTLEGGAASKYQYAFQFYDFATRQTTRIATFDRENPSLLISSITVSPDERRLVYGQRDHLDYDLILVENFR